MKASGNTHRLGCWQELILLALSGGPLWGAEIGRLLGADTNAGNVAITLRQHLKCGLVSRRRFSPGAYRWRWDYALTDAGRAALAQAAAERQRVEEMARGGPRCAHTWDFNGHTRHCEERVGHEGLCCDLSGLQQEGNR